VIESRLRPCDYFIDYEAGDRCEDSTGIAALAHVQRESRWLADFVDELHASHSAMLWRARGHKAARLKHRIFKGLLSFAAPR
jgi:hypothetical protein